MKTIGYFLLCFVCLPISALLFIVGFGSPLMWTLKRMENFHIYT